MRMVAVVSTGIQATSSWPGREVGIFRRYLALAMSCSEREWLFFQRDFLLGSSEEKKKKLCGKWREGRGGEDLRLGAIRACSNCHL